jgi:phospholipase/lecithinase/hemolysin
MAMRFFIKRGLLFLTLLVVSSALPAHAFHYDAFYVFGDSLSDTGNDLTLTRVIGVNPAIPPSVSPHRTYYPGRFSNGPVAVEYLWHLLKQDPGAPVVPILAGADPARKGALNMAFGGSGSGISNQTLGGFKVPGVLGQVDLFRVRLLGRKPQPQALYFIWTGANDYILGLTNDPSIVVGNISKSIEQLYALGARQFLVLDLPDLGLVPIVVAQGLGPALSQLTSAHNALLAQSMNLLEAHLFGIRIVRGDVFAMANQLLGSTIAFPSGLDSVAPGGASTCLFVNPGTCPDVMLVLDQPFFFWDAEHPTTFVHGVLGQKLFDALSQ